MSYLDQAKAHYNKRYPGNDVAPIGASEAEVNELEVRLGLRLPEAHRELLLWMGNDHMGILSDARWYVRDIERLTRSLPEWLVYNKAEPLSPGTFVSCYNYAGYANGWYEIPYDDEDPWMHLYVEGDKKHPKPYIWGKLSDWVLEFMEGSHMPVMRQQKARKEYDEEQARLKAAGGNASGGALPPL